MASEQAMKDIIVGAKRIENVGSWKMGEGVVIVN